MGGRCENILLMEEILHYLGCIKPCKSWDKLPIRSDQLVQDFSHQQYQAVSLDDLCLIFMNVLLVICDSHVCQYP